MASQPLVSAAGTADRVQRLHRGAASQRSNATPLSVFVDGDATAVPAGLPLPRGVVVDSSSNVYGVSATSHQRQQQLQQQHQHPHYPSYLSGSMEGTPSKRRAFLSQVMCCAGRVQAGLRYFGLMSGDEDQLTLTQMVVCTSSIILLLLVLLLALTGFLCFLFVSPTALRGGGGPLHRHTSQDLLSRISPLLTAGRLQQFLQQAHQAEVMRRRALRNETLWAAMQQRARQGGDAAKDISDLASLAQTLPGLERLSAQLLRVSVYVQAVHSHDPQLGLVELSDFLLNAKGRGAALERAAAQARRETLNATTPGAAAAAVDDAGAEWSAALKTVFAGRAEAARLRAQLRGFVGVPAGQTERWTRQPFDDVAMLQYRHAWTQSEVVPRLLRRRTAPAAAAAAAAAAVRAYDVANRAALKADLYEAASIFNHVYYYPLRRYAALQAYAPASVADTDAWYAEVAAGVQARFSAAAVVAHAVDAGVAASMPVVARGSPLSALSLARLPVSREEEVAHLRTALDVEWMPEALHAGAAVNQQTIFISLASYRDMECPPTVLDVFRVARNPHRVYVGLAQQNRAGDTSCLLPEMYGPSLCPSGGGDVLVDAHAPLREAEARHRSLRGGTDFRAKHPDSAVALFDERVCFFADHIRVREIDSRQAKGPTYGRYMAMLLYRGEELTMVLDSHNKFRPMWDTLGASMLQRYHEPKAALSHYPEAYDPTTSNFDPYKTSTAYLCKAFFMKNFGYPRLNGIVIGSPGDFVQNNVYNDAYAYEKSGAIQRATSFRLPQPWVAGGFLFTSGTIFRDVPFDPHLPYIFDGEEVLYSVRLWTHGYNIYSPPRGLCFHIYGRAKAPKVWSESALWYAVQDRVRPRIWFYLQSHKKGNPHLLFPANTTSAYVVVDSSRYGMGKQRTVAQWYAYAGADPVNQTMDGRWCGVATE